MQDDRFELQLVGEIALRGDAEPEAERQSAPSWNWLKPR
jgi:hypothetical protein